MLADYLQGELQPFSLNIHTNAEGANDIHDLLPPDACQLMHGCYYANGNI